PADVNHRVAGHLVGKWLGVEEGRGEKADDDDGDGMDAAHELRPPSGDTDRDAHYCPRVRIMQNATPSAGCSRVVPRGCCTERVYKKASAPRRVILRRTRRRISVPEVPPKSRFFAE